MTKTQNRMSLSGKIKFSRSYTILFFALLTIILLSFKVSAQAEITDTLIKERIQHIQKMLDQGKPAANLWWKGWLYGYTAATVVQGVVFSTSDNLKTRQDMALGAATTIVGAVGQLIMPMVPGYAPGRLALIPGNSPEERILKLAEAEELFKASSDREKEGRSWKMHAATGAINAGTGLVTWLGFDRTLKSGLIVFALNTVITEVQIFTQPTRAIRDYKDYCEKYKYGFSSVPYKVKPRLFINACPGGLALRMIF